MLKPRARTWTLCARAYGVICGPLVPSCANGVAQGSTKAATKPICQRPEPAPPGGVPWRTVSAAPDGCRLAAVARLTAPPRHCVGTTQRHEWSGVQRPAASPAALVGWWALDSGPAQAARLLSPAACWLTIESMKQPSLSNAFQTSKSTQHHHNFQHKIQSWNKEKNIRPNPRSPTIKNLCWKAHESNCVEFECWKHIYTNQTADKLIQ